MTANALPAELAAEPLEIVVRRLADDLRFGQDTSRYVGSGVDFAESRPMVEGDSVRDIDWPVTGRTGRFHVKQYESLKTTPVYMMVDTSASMAFRSHAVSKHYLATLIAGVLGMAALVRLSPVGVFAGGSRSLHHPPSLSRARVFQWLHELARCRFDESTELDTRIGQLEGLLKSSALVVVLSDLHEPAAIGAIKRLATRHDVMAIQIEDPAERGRLRGGFFRGREAETGRGFTAHGRTRWFGRREPPSKALQSAGVDHLLLRTDEPPMGSLRHFLLARGGLFRNAR